MSTGTSVNLGTGTNKLTLAAGGNTGAVSNVNTLIGGTGDDTVALNTTVANGSISLGAGNDTLTFANGTNTATVAGSETIVGGTGTDTINLSAAAAAASIDLGSGSDTLTFGNFANSASVANVETIVGGTAADSVTLGNALTTAGQINLGGGSNKLTLTASATPGPSVASTRWSAAPATTPSPWAPRSPMVLSIWAQATTLCPWPTAPIP